MMKNNINWLLVDISNHQARWISNQVHIQWASLYSFDHQSFHFSYKVFINQGAYGGALYIYILVLSYPSLPLKFVLKYLCRVTCLIIGCPEALVLEHLEPSEILSQLAN